MRELENTITRLVALSEGGPIDAAALGASSASASEPRAASGTFREQVEQLERALLTDALQAAGGNQSEAARRLGLSRPTFIDKLKRYGLV